MREIAVLAETEVAHAREITVLAEPPGGPAEAERASVREIVVFADLQVALKTPKGPRGPQRWLGGPPLWTP